MFRDPLAQFEVEKREHDIKMHKMEQEMEEVFEMKVQEKLQKLKDIEADVSVCGWCCGHCSWQPVIDHPLTLYS